MKLVEVHWSMELEGAKRAFAYLISVGLKIAVFMSDRHRGIAKWIRECQPNTAHYFDIWHVARSIGKAMLKLSKQKGCERIGDWIKGVRNHLYSLAKIFPRSRRDLGRDRGRDLGAFLAANLGRDRGRDLGAFLAAEIFISPRSRPRSRH